MIFRANWGKILKEGIHRVMHEDKYHGHVPGQTLSRRTALRVKCEMDMHCDHLNAVRDILAERERTPSAQLRQALAALKESVDTRLRLPLLPHATGAVPVAHWWLSGNVKLGLIWGSFVHCDVFVLVCCAFCVLGNVHLMFFEVLDTHLVKVQGEGGHFFLVTAQLTERPIEPSLSRH